jgi:hypothetical protein
MKLFAYYRQDHNGFALFFNHCNTVQRVVVEDVSGLKHLLLTNPLLLQLNSDSIEEAKETLIDITLFNIIPQKDIEGLIAL